MESKLILFSCLLLTAATAAAAANVRAAYWSQGSGFPVSSVDATLFTHLFCAFAAFDPNTNQLSSLDASFSQFTSTLQQKNPSIKTLLSIDAGGTKASPFAAMTTSSSSRKSFIDSSINAARSHNFHGLDLDYENPHTAADMSNLAALLSEWRAAVNAESSATGKPPLLLTAAVYYTSVYHSVPLPAASLARNLDWINLMAYDLWAPGWSKLTRPTAALYDPLTGISGSEGVNAWIQAGVPRSKIVLGLPFYGYAWRLADAGNHGYLAASTGPASGTDGDMTYKQIKVYLAANGGTTVYNASTVENYSYSGNTWFSYDGVEAVAGKMGFVRDKGLLGYFAWHVGADDDNSSLAKAAARS